MDKIGVLSVESLNDFLSNINNIVNVKLNINISFLMLFSFVLLKSLDFCFKLLNLFFNFLSGFELLLSESVSLSGQFKAILLTGCIDFLLVSLVELLDDSHHINFAWVNWTFQVHPC